MDDYFANLLYESIYESIFTWDYFCGRFCGSCKGVRYISSYGEFIDCPSGGCIDSDLCVRYSDYVNMCRAIQGLTDEITTYFND